MLKKVINDQNFVNSVDKDVEVSVPDQHKTLIQELINKNSDIFAAKDSELGNTDLVRMELDTGNHYPIKLRLYRTPINNLVIIDKAVDEMLDAKIIRRSRSLWSFQL